ncbi:MAG: glycerophosphodiester phosphodiesterase [Flavobacteriales bacterium]|nr:glycerophosphodiester phosphodiesterase [Flavobacteriales bacterium]
MMGNYKLNYIATALAMLLGACAYEPVNRPDIHGHRGCRGLMPENTVPAFEKALELGCEWLEMDVVITADSQVLVSHEPWMEHRICRTPEGDSITEMRSHTFNIYRMSLAEVQAFDCGSAQHPDFPDQENQKLHKPSLREVVEAVEEKAMELGAGGINYNIEIKSEPTLYGTYQPEPKRFVEVVLAQLDSLGLDGRCVVQSFDPAVLESVHALNDEIPTALLVDNTDGLEINLRRLSFTPAYYSPAFALVDKGVVKDLLEKGIQLLVWTVNEKSDMKRMIKLGVNGIITDYPDRLIELLDENE